MMMYRPMSRCKKITYLWNGKSMLDILMHNQHYVQENHIKTQTFFFLGGRRMILFQLKEYKQDECPLCVMALGLSVPCTNLAEYKVVWSEDLPAWSAPHAVHGSWLHIHQDNPGHVLAATGLVVVDITPSVNERITMLFFDDQPRKVVQSFLKEPRV